MKITWKEIWDTFFVIEHHELKRDGGIIHGFFINPIACMVWCLISLAIFIVGFWIIIGAWW